MGTNDWSFGANRLFDYQKKYQCKRRCLLCAVLALSLSPTHNCISELVQIRINSLASSLEH